MSQPVGRALHFEVEKRLFHSFNQRVVETVFFRLMKEEAIAEWRWQCRWWWWGWWGCCCRLNEAHFLVCVVCFAQKASQSDKGGLPKTPSDPLFLFPIGVSICLCRHRHAIDCRCLFHRALFSCSVHSFSTLLLLWPTAAQLWFIKRKKQFYYWLDSGYLTLCRRNENCRYSRNIRLFSQPDTR